MMKTPEEKLGKTLGTIAAVFIAIPIGILFVALVMKICETNVGLALAFAVIVLLGFIAYKLEKRRSAEMERKKETIRILEKLIKDEEEKRKGMRK